MAEFSIAPPNKGLQGTPGCPWLLIFRVQRAPDAPESYRWAVAPLLIDRMPEPLGLESRTVRIVAYDPRWADLYHEEAERIRGAVAAAGLPPIRIEHVGSTAVPGLPAKPILDIVAGRDSAVPASVYVAVFEAAGYVYRGESGVPGRDFFRRGALRSHHVHMVEYDSEQWRRYLGLRDVLRATPALCEQYAALKQELAALYTGDREAYTEGKTDFIEKVIREAGRNLPGEAP